MATQATIAYKVNPLTGEPLDINGVPTALSGKRQAVALLMGTANPNAALYEVEFYFSAGDVVTGNPTIAYTDSCPPELLTVTPDYLNLGGTYPLTGTLTVTSGTPWHIVDPPTFARFEVLEGGAGVFVISVSSGSTEGQGYVYFENEAGQTARVYISNLTARVWILDTGFWNMQGFWFDNGIWNY